MLTRAEHCALYMLKQKGAEIEFELAAHTLHTPFSATHDEAAAALPEISLPDVKFALGRGL
eukprot:6419053-Prymnesium_polylepis.1